MKYAFFALVMTMITATAASASWVSRDLNMRAGPGTHNHIRHVLPRCANVHVHRRHHNWYQVSWRGHQGWVSGHYLARHRPHYCGHGGYHRRPQHHHHQQYHHRQRRY